MKSFAAISLGVSAGSQSPLNNAFSYNGLPTNSLDITADGAHVSDPGCNCATISGCCAAGRTACSDALSWSASSLSTGASPLRPRDVSPPRAAYVDFPLGHTSGKPHQPTLNRAIVRDALAAFESLTQPGQVRMLPYEWADDDVWKDAVMRPSSASAFAA